MGARNDETPCPVTGFDCLTCEPGACALAAKTQGHYGEWCRDPKLCAGKGYCPRDPNCAD